MKEKLMSLITPKSYSNVKDNTSISLKNFLKSNKLMVSIDIGNSEIKIIKGIYDGNKVRIDNAISLPTPDNILFDGKIIDIPRFNMFIGEELKNQGFKAKYAVCTIENSTVIRKDILIPDANPEEIKAMLEFEIEQYFPIDLEKYVFQHRITEQVEDEGLRKSNVLVVALPKDIIENHYNLISSLGFKAEILDLHSNCVHKLFNSKVKINRSNSLEHQTVALIDLGHAFSNLIMIKDGVFKFNRILQIGGKEIDISIANYFNLSIQESEKKKKEIISLNHKYEENNAVAMVLNLTKNCVNNWIEELDRVFKYYISRANGNRIDKIYIFGGSSNIKGLDSYLEKKFQIPTYKISELNNVEIGSNLKGLNIETYINALGAMIRR